MMAIAAAMPEEKFTYKSTPAQRDYGQQIMHVATGNMAYLRFFGGKAAAPAFNATQPRKPRSSRRSPHRSISGGVIREQSDQSMLQIVHRTNQFLGPSSKARVHLFPDRAHVGHLRSDGPSTFD
jgi:hypothetical protein